MFYGLTLTGMPRRVACHACDVDPGQPYTRTPPTMRVQSSKEGNEHVYWRLESFCENIGQIEDRNRAIAYILRTDVSGWDCNQILRPQGQLITKDSYLSHYAILNAIYPEDIINSMLLEQFQQLFNSLIQAWTSKIYQELKEL